MNGFKDYFDGCRKRSLVLSKDYWGNLKTIHKNFIFWVWTVGVIIVGKGIAGRILGIVIFVLLIPLFESWHNRLRGD